jgi:ketosteroid isomerase-like protein
MMRKLVGLALWLMLCSALSGTPARAETEQDIRALYAAFVDAQNRRDIPAVRGVLSARADFLWISDGRPVWGREAMLERMASFQSAEVWMVEPDYPASRVILLDGDTAVFHLPLVLVIGSRADPARLRWLVEVICQKETGGWRIAGLYTAQDKR